MRFLLDEQLATRTARALNELGDAAFEHILESQSQGTRDEDIPDVGRRRSIDAFITVNVRDFGARKLLYEALLANGISVVVLRPGRAKMDVIGQAHFILQHLRRIQSLLAASRGPLLIIVTTADVRSRDLDELVAEFEP